jgi:putative transcriptional regulator
MTDCASIDLKHHFLIAMPGLEDEIFTRSVVYMCEHSPRGAMGLIINKPTDISMRLLFDKVDLSLRREDLVENPVGHGGPVQTERGFVLHEPMWTDKPASDGQAVYASTLTVPGGLEMTTSRDVLEAMSCGVGPRRVLVTLGYASWGEGQLESELGENAWLTVPASADVVFEVPMAERYDRALDLLGLKSWMLSLDAGHA